MSDTALKAYRQPLSRQFYRALGYDEFRLGRARTLEELAAAIDAITLDQLQAYLARRKFGPFTVVSVGPVGLSLPQDQAAAPVCG